VGGKPWEGDEGNDRGHHGCAVQMLRWEDKGTAVGPLHFGPMAESPGHWVH